MAMYNYGGHISSYNTMVDKSATVLPPNWMGNPGAGIPKIFYEAVQFQNLLTPIYGTMAIRVIHPAGNNIFLIEYEDTSIHVMQVYALWNAVAGGIGGGQRYYSPTTTQTVTGLIGDWELSSVIRGGSASLVFMKRKDAVAPYKAFKTETTQYGKDDVSEGNNVRVFFLHFYAYNKISDGDKILPDWITGDLYDNQHLGVLKSSTTTATFVDSKYGTGSRLSWDARESLLQYHLTNHLKHILEEGFLPTRTIEMGQSVLVLFEKEDGEKEWHTLNFSAGPDAQGGAYNEDRHKRSAQYLLSSNSLDGYSIISRYATILFIGTREDMKNSAEFVRLQAVMTAFEGKAASEKGFDDLVFVKRIRYDKYIGLSGNATQLQAYVKSTNKTFTLGPSTSGVNLVEVTDTVLNLDPQNYIDRKDGPTYGVWGGPIARLHNWLFANDQFAAVPLKEIYLQKWGLVLVRDV
jgi:hypothetical protein